MTYGLAETVAGGELQTQVVPPATSALAPGADTPESATLSCAMHKLAITMTMATGDPRPLAIHPIINMARLARRSLRSSTNLVALCRRTPR